MTNTTTDAAEARAREDRAKLIRNRVLIGMAMAGEMENPGWEEEAGVRAMLAFATAEAASRAGERETSDRLGAWLSAALDDPKVCDAMKADIEAWFGAGKPAASLPPATDPAIQKLEQTLLLARSWINHTRSCAFWTHTPTEDGYRIDCTCPYGEHVAYIDAALAAAPTIPATGGEVMVWSPPRDNPIWHVRGERKTLCGRAIGRCYTTENAAQVTCKKCASLSTLATIPATGHAATVAPDDLRPWGYAPGEYVFRCRDCPADPPFEQRPLGDKRSWRCKPHAEAARDAAGHAATEGEGA